MRHSYIALRLIPHLQAVDMPLGKVLYESGDTLRHVYFPTDCIVSLLYVMVDGASAEISVVGNEAVVKKETDRLLPMRLAQVS